MRHTSQHKRQIMRIELTHERLLSELSYDKEAGDFRWLSSGFGRRTDRPVGGINKVSGYIEIGIDGGKYFGHRLAWFYATGEWPKLKIDHINCIRHDNRISNLRLASDFVNAQNIRSPSKNNTSGFLGVSFCKCTNRWISQITYQGRHHNLGRFDSPEAAYAVYLQGKRQLHEGCTL